MGTYLLINSSLSTIEIIWCSVPDFRVPPSQRTDLYIQLIHHRQRRYLLPSSLSLRRVFGDYLPFYLSHSRSSQNTIIEYKDTIFCSNSPCEGMSIWIAKKSDYSSMAAPVLCCAVLCCAVLCCAVMHARRSNVIYKLNQYMIKKVLSHCWLRYQKLPQKWRTNIFLLMDEMLMWLMRAHEIYTPISKLDLFQPHTISGRCRCGWVGVWVIT